MNLPYCQFCVDLVTKFLEALWMLVQRFSLWIFVSFSSWLEILNVEVTNNENVCWQELWSKLIKEKSEVLVSEISSKIDFRETNFRLETVLVNCLELCAEVSTVIHSCLQNFQEYFNISFCFISYVSYVLWNSNLSTTNYCNAMGWCNNIKYLSSNKNTFISLKAEKLKVRLGP